MKDRTLEELIDELVKLYEVNGYTLDSIEMIPDTGRWFIQYIDSDSDVRVSDAPASKTIREAVELEIKRLNRASRQAIKDRVREIDFKVANLWGERNVLVCQLEAYDD